MKTLVLCVDRDNDLGVKTGIEGPVIGREENVKAALALGLADPEDADTNTIFAAISAYDHLRRKNLDAEVVTILGDIDVGYTSDLILTRQLEEAIEVTGATNAILISNGAEDEYIFPIISSRIKVDSVKSVLVKQSRSIEGFYYYIVKLLKDSKTRKQIIAPIGMALLLFGTISLLPFFQILVDGTFSEAIDELSSRATGAFSFMVGLFLLQMAYQIGNLFREGPRRVRRSLSEGDLTLPFFIFALLLSLFGALNGYNRAKSLDDTQEGFFNAIFMFLDGSLYWFAGSVLVYEFKSFANSMLSRESLPKTFWTLVTSIIAVTFLMLGGLHFILKSTELLPEIPYSSIAVEITLGLGIAIVGGLVQRRVKTDIATYKEGWRR